MSEPFKLIHECPEFDRCWDGITAGLIGGYGEAIGDKLYFREHGGFWVADNGEYASVIRFCPFCGIELRTLENNL